MSTPKSHDGVRSIPRLKRLRAIAATCAVLIGMQSAAQAAKVLFVQANNLRDTTKLINILQAQGHDLTVHDTGTDGNALTATEYQAMGYELLLVDEVISSGTVGDRFRDSPIPVINWEGYLYNGARSSFNDDSGVTGGNYADAAEAQAINGGAGADHGQVLNETKVDIINASHPLAAGLPAGPIDVFDPNVEPSATEGTGVITFAGARTFITGAGVHVVATVPGFADGYAIFGIEAGTLNKSGTPIPARWVHLPWNDSVEDRVMIEPSFFLFEAAVAWALELPEPTKIRNLTPESAGFLPVEQTITFSVDKTSNSGSAVDQGGIDLTINGESVIGAATISDGGDSWNVSYSATLDKNASYTIVASATAADGGTSARLSAIDTFTTDNYTVEAEDFNFGGGMFIDDPILCAEFGGGVEGCYYDRIGVEGVDEHEINMVYSTGGVNNIPDGTSVYRFSSDPVGITREEFMDTFVTSDELRQKFVDAELSDYHIANFGPEEWVNYTRTFPAGNYKVFARVSSAGPLTLQLDMIDDGTSATQTITGKAGRFVSAAGTGGTFATIPLTDDTGVTPLVVTFDGTPTTIRLTSLSEGAVVNFLTFAETTEEVQVPPTVTLTSPAANSVFNEGSLIPITADASDDGSVVKVEFYAGIGTSLELIATDTEAPYEAAFTPPALGQLNTYTIKAVATDDTDLVGESSVNVQVNDNSLQVITTADGAGADSEMRENDGGDSGNGGSDRMNARINATGDANRHEVIALRFDFGNTIMSELTSASLNVVSFRTLGSRNLHVYGIKDGATGGDNNGATPGYTDDDWDEGATTFSTMPGLIWDGDQTTRGVNADDVVDLGIWTLALNTGEIGTLDTVALLDFLRASPDGLVSFLIESEDDGNGQARFATKEAATIDDGRPGEAGDFAASITFRVGGNIAPVVSITSPEDGAQYNEGDSVTVTADASDDGNIANVAFYEGATLISTDTEAPYEATFTPSSTGSVMITAVATDNEGATAQSSINITVLAPSALPPVGKLGTIAWVSFHPGDDEPSAAAASAGFTEAPDVEYTRLLAANGFNVERHITSGTPDAAALNAADLVIISRSVSSGNYSGDAATAWNAIEAPMIVMGGYTLRSSRMGYTTGSTMVDTAETVSLKVADPSHPIFAGIALDGSNNTVNPFANITDFMGTTQRGVSVNNDPVNADGTVLATVSTGTDPTVGGLVIGEWQAGSTMMHDGGAGTDILAGHRLVFLSGSREASGLTAEGSGIFDLTEDGAKMFINAVNYMLHPTPYNIVWVGFHEAADSPSAGAAGVGFTEAPDRGYTDLLEAAGYNVTRYITTGSPDVETLSQADLVIVGRSVSSGNYQNDSATAWNSIDAPLMAMSGWTLRSSRMGFTSGTSITDTTGDINLAVADPMHAIFSGISITDGVMDNPFAGVVTYPTDGTTLARGISVNTDAMNGGTLLASISGSTGGPEGGMIIAEWEPGATLTHAGGAGSDVLTASRLVFLSGSREADGISSETAGLFDLADDGAQMFLNAVRYGVSRKVGGSVAPAEPVFTSIVFAGGSVTIEWTGDATLEATSTIGGATDWQPVAGATSPYTTTPSDDMFFRLSR